MSKGENVATSIVCHQCKLGFDIPGVPPYTYETVYEQAAKVGWLAVTGPSMKRSVLCPSCMPKDPE